MNAVDLVDAMQSGEDYWSELKAGAIVMSVEYKGEQVDITPILDDDHDFCWGCVVKDGKMRHTAPIKLDYGMIKRKLDRCEYSVMTFVAVMQRNLLEDS